MFLVDPNKRAVSYQQIEVEKKKNDNEDMNRLEELTMKLNNADEKNSRFP